MQLNSAIDPVEGKPTISPRFAVKEAARDAAEREALENILSSDEFNGDVPLTGPLLKETKAPAEAGGQEGGSGRWFGGFGSSKSSTPPARGGDAV